MKKITITMVSLAILSLPFSIKAQDEKLEKVEKKEKIERKEKIEKIEKKDKKEKVERKETQEIIIRNKGKKDLNLKVEINGDKITVNGKPLDEFKDDQVTINNRKMMIRDGDGVMTYDFGPDNWSLGQNFSRDFMGQWKGEGREVIKPFLGVTTEKVAEGAKITEIVKQSAAEKAGLKKDDIIKKLGDETITDAENLADVVSSKKPKEPVKVTYLRDGKEATVTAILGERKIKPSMAYAYNYPNGKVRSFAMPKIAPNVNINEDLLNKLEPLAPGTNFDISPYFDMDNSFSRQKKLGLKIQDTEEGGNVKVIEVEEGSAAEKAGLKKDDIITEIDGEKIENTDDAREQLMPAETKSAYTIKAKRDGAEMSFEVKFPKKIEDSQFIKYSRKAKAISNSINRC